VIVLDTNVISELMRSQPHPAVTAWVAAQSRGSLYTTSVNEAELFYGISAMPEGRRRSGLAAGAEALFAEEFAGRVLVFGGAAAGRYAEIVILRRQAGKPIEAFDALIAATALVAGAAVATRDIAGFEGCGLTLFIRGRCRDRHLAVIRPHRCADDSPQGISAARRIVPLAVHPPRDNRVYHVEHSDVLQFCSRAEGWGR
jgi:toxin FitB